MSDLKTSFSLAVNRLQEALEVEPTALNRDASIQRFEFVFELAWKVVQKALREEGLDCASPRSCMKAAYRQGWIHDESAWLTIMEDRNLTSHTYDETLAVAVYGRLAGHLVHFQGLINSVAQLSCRP